MPQPSASDRRQSVRAGVVWDGVRRVLEGDDASGGQARIVDIGGGTGGFAVPLAELGHTVQVIDPSPDALASLDRRARERGVADRVTGQQGDLSDLPSLVEEADLVLCHGVLEMVDEPAASLAAIGDVLRAHLPSDDPLHGYAERLDDPSLRRTVRGYLAGSIDLVLRLGGRFAIVDYKTNWLAGPGESPTAWHHRPVALAAEMQRAHYGLQALLYTVALHRYLRWRLPGYAPERHLAGVLYLFLRGMTGVDTPVVDGTPCGVFAWRPPDGLVAALSDVLDRGGSG